jgi:integrase
VASIDKWAGGRWRARYRTPDGKSRSQVFDRKIDAQRFLTSIEHSKLASRYVDPAAGRVSFRTYAEQWRKIQPYRDGTERLVEQQLRLHVYPHIGDRPIGAIRQSEVQAMVRRASVTLAPSTIQVVYGRVVSVFRAAVRDRILVDSPCVDVKLPKPSSRVDNVMSTAQVLALAEAFTPAHLDRRGLHGRYRALVLVGAGTGLRPGELFGLTLPAIDFLRRTLSVERQLVRVKGGVELTTSLKTEKSRRVVPLAKVVVDVLAAHLGHWPADGRLGLVFTNERGGPIQQYPFSQAWATARDRAALPSWVNGPHQLRHHFASLLIARGASVKVVQRRLGHASAKTTLDVYGHLWPDDEDATRAAIDDELGAALAGNATATGTEDT